MRVATILPESLSNTMAVLSAPPVVRGKKGGGGGEREGGRKERMNEGEGKYGQLEVHLKNKILTSQSP